MVCFAHFDFEMCFAPQLRALFQHLNFQKFSDSGVFLTCLLGCFTPQRRALFPHCNFEKFRASFFLKPFDFEMCFTPRRHAIFHVIWPDGSAPATLASLLFDPPAPQIGKIYSVSPLLYLFAHLDLFSLSLSLSLSSDSFFSDILSSSLLLLFFSLLFSSFLFSSPLLSSLLFSSLFFRDF